MDYYRTDNRRTQMLRGLSFKGMTETHTIDWSAWSDGNGNLSTVTASVESGQATIGNESLASNVKTFTLTTSEVGASMIKFTATAGNNVDTVYLYVFTKDPQNFTEDYGICP